MQPHRCIVIAAFATLVPERLIVAQSAAEPASRRREGATLVAATGRFGFHSDPWMNLHHFLYQWAREDAGIGTGRRRVMVPERSGLGALSGEERAAWLRSVAFYEKSVAPRGHFDSEMLELKRDLLNLAGDRRARPPDRITGIAAALSGAMPIYWKKWWPRHAKGNRAWIKSVAARLRAHEKRYVEMTIRVHGAVWPKERWRVDVSAYANSAAGYTTSEGHVVIYSADSGNRDLYALETVFHEIQHARVIFGQTSSGLARAFEAAGAELPPNLWHALIFATAGEFVRSVAASEGRPRYIPYWIKEGFENLQGWSNLVPAVNEHWLPVVRGEVFREAGLASLSRAFRP